MKIEERVDRIVVVEGQEVLAEFLFHNDINAYENAKESAYRWLEGKVGGEVKGAEPTVEVKPKRRGNPNWVKGMKAMRKREKGMDD